MSEVHEQYKAFRRRTSTPSYRRWIRKTYSNRRAYKKVVRAWEVKFATCLLDDASTRAQGATIRPRYADTDGVLEHLLSWALGSPRGLWCDGVDDLMVTALTARTFAVEGIALIGPTSNIAEGCAPFRMTGTFEVSANRPRLRQYSVTIDYGKGLTVSKRAI